MLQIQAPEFVRDKMVQLDTPGIGLSILSKWTITILTFPQAFRRSAETRFLAYHRKKSEFFLSETGFLDPLTLRYLNPYTFPVRMLRPYESLNCSNRFDIRGQSKLLKLI